MSEKPRLLTLDASETGSRPFLATPQLFKLPHCPTTPPKLTGYRYKLGLDPSFVEERPEFKKGQLHWYEWILCETGGNAGADGRDSER